VDITILGKVAGVVAREDQRFGLVLADRLAGLLGDPPDPERAAKLRELADLLTDFGVHLRARADALAPVIIDVPAGVRDVSA
jgi:hypothetical protein